jgi:hypothetical protein
MLHTKLHPAKTTDTEQKMFSSETGEDIGYEHGAKMIKNYHDQNDVVVSHFLGRDMIEAILDQPGVVGITVFNGLDESGLPKPILVGVNSKGDFVLNITTVGDDGELLKQKGMVAVGVRSPGTKPPYVEESYWW